MTREEIENDIWNICTRLGAINGELYHIRHGNIKEPTMLPNILVMLINKNFNDLFEVNNFFAPINKEKNIVKFRNMLNEIAPFKHEDIVLNGSLFLIKSKNYTIVETEYTNY